MWDWGTLNVGGAFDDLQVQMIGLLDERGANFRSHDFTALKSEEECLNAMLVLAWMLKLVLVHSVNYRKRGPRLRHTAIGLFAWATAARTQDWSTLQHFQYFNKNLVDIVTTVVGVSEQEPSSSHRSWQQNLRVTRVVKQFQVSLQQDSRLAKPTDLALKSFMFWSHKENGSLVFSIVKQYIPPKQI